MAQFVEYREDGTVPYRANNPETLDLSRGTLCREMLLRLTMQPTATAGQNAAANVQWGGPWGVIRRLEIVLNGSDSILNLTGADLSRLAWHQLGIAPDVPDTLGDGATANPALDVSLIVPFWMPRAAKPMDTVLDTRRLASYSIRVTWGTFTDVISAATAWTAEPVLTVQQLRSSGEIAADARFTEWRRFAIVQDATVTNPQLRVQLPTGFVYRGFAVNLYDTSLPGDSATPANLKRIRVKSGSTTFADLSAQALQAWYRQRYGIPFDAAAIPDAYTDGDNNIGSWWFLDNVTDGRLKEATDTARYSEYILEADITGAANQQLRILPMALVPPRG